MNHKRERKVMDAMMKAMNLRAILTELQSEELESVGSINPVFIQRREEFLKAFGAMLNGLNNGIFRVNNLMGGTLDEEYHQLMGNVIRSRIESLGARRRS